MTSLPGSIVVEGDNFKMEKKIKFPEPLAGLIQECETFCIAYCCGIDAFDISEANIKRWKAKHSEADFNLVKSQLENIIKQSLSFQGKLSSAQLNWVCPQIEFINWLKEFDNKLKNS
jgi:hypothetical protein